MLGFPGCLTSPVLNAALLLSTCQHIAQCMQPLLFPAHVYLCLVVTLLFVHGPVQSAPLSQKYCFSPPFHRALPFWLHSTKPVASFLGLPLSFSTSFPTQSRCASSVFPSDPQLAPAVARPYMMLCVHHLLQQSPRETLIHLLQPACSVCLPA